jgi:hypothetical protein
VPAGAPVIAAGRVAQRGVQHAAWQLGSLLHSVVVLLVLSVAILL